MSDVWVSAPRKAPGKCRRSGRDTEAEGPYFEDALPYCEAPGDDRELTQYISVGWLRAIADAPGSPIVVVDRASYQQDGLAMSELIGERDELALKVRELEEKLSVFREPPPVDVDALASALVIPLGAHFARRTGPKPKQAA